MCTLNGILLEKAKKELNEDPSDRMNSINAFRTLLKTRCPHIKCSYGKLEKFLSFCIFSTECRVFLPVLKMFWP